MTANRDIKLPPHTKLNLVVAKNHRHYRLWFTEVLEEPGTYQYVKSPEHLRGYSTDNTQILLLDDWQVGHSEDYVRAFTREIMTLKAAGMEVHYVSSY